MKKYITTIIVILSIFIFILIFSGCDELVGKSAYDIAVDNGFVGTEAEWLESLKGEDGEDGAAVSAGKSAYEIAVDNGFVGTEAEWLESLKGEDGTNGVDSSLMSVSYASNIAILSTVTIYCEYADSSTAAGSGIIISDDKENGDAYIITNYHVVYNPDTQPEICENITIYLYAMQYEQYEISATYIGGAMTYDVAVLKIDNSDVYKTSAARPAIIDESIVPHVGDTAIAIGNPQGTGLSVTTGIVSVDSEHLEMTGADNITMVKFRVLRIDTAVNSGNSGGGLFNAAGQLIGMVNAKIMSTNVENIGYAIPLSIVMNTYNNILRNCDGVENTSIKRCLLGIEINAAESQAVYNQDTKKTDIVEKVIVHSVSESGAAYNLLQVDDEIVSFTYNGVTTTLTRVYQVVDFSLNFEHNETLTLSIIRDGTPMNVDIQLVNVIDVA